jgi:hypothetical protein
VWDLTSGRQTHLLAAHTSSMVNCVALSTNSKVAVSASKYEIVVWDWDLAKGWQPRKKRKTRCVLGVAINEEEEWPLRRSKTILWRCGS